MMFFLLQDYGHHLKRPHLLIQIKSHHWFFSFVISARFDLMECVEVRLYPYVSVLPLVSALLGEEADPVIKCNNYTVCGQYLSKIYCLAWNQDMKPSASKVGNQALTNQVTSFTSQSKEWTADRKHLQYHLPLSDMHAG